ncbi:MAG: (2E,6E)-farnesyl diphosphate synthase, partial [Pantoea sp.]|nr:(2E,6E)-farnesyl diphosphate synthase [Pantoea sp.]
MDFAQMLNGYHQQVNAALTRFIEPLPFQSSPLVNAMHYGALLGGKRLRPFLVYATGEMLHADPASLDAPAAAVECIHAYSLIHDDLPAMDDDALRRGQPTCHIKYGEDTAILAGDALQTLAFSILTDEPMPGVNAEYRLMMLSELARASGVAGMCGGQALDLAAEGQSVDLVQLEQIHRHKTGALIRAAVRLGALAAGEAGRAALPALDRYADAIGLAFQVQDDILDVVGDTAVIGKRQGADQHLGKSTYPSLLGLEQARAKARDLYQEA